MFHCKNGYLIPVRWSSSIKSIMNEDLPRITCPQKLQKEYQKYQEKQFKQQLLSKKQSRNRGPMVISCKRRNYNYHKGDSFSEFDVQKLVSFGWKNKKRVGDSFSIVPFSDNPSLDIGTDISFSELGINEKLCAGLQEMGIVKPTSIQKMAIPTLLTGNSALCTAETGSGKTLAYLLPTVEWILKHRNSMNMKANSNSPTSVVLTPNRELTEQVMSVAESLTPYSNFFPYSCVGGDRLLKRDVSMPFDMLITTPGALIKHLRTKRVNGYNLRHFVIDESDTLLDDSFISDLHTIFQMLKVQPGNEIQDDVQLLQGTQIILTSATMPVSVSKALEFLPVDNMAKITTQGLHHLQPHVMQKFLRINSQKKPEKLVELVKQSLELNEPTLVFANDNKTSFYLYKLLSDNGITCLRLNSDLNNDQRKGVFQKFKSGFCDVLVATDIASRGLDTTNVQHVINYNFPTFISDYIHRVGRVGRVGVKQTGHVTSFVTEKWDVELVWKIETAARKKGKLAGVNANIKEKLDKESLSQNDQFDAVFVEDKKLFD